MPVNPMECSALFAHSAAQSHRAGTNSVTVVSTEAQWFRWGCAEGLELMRARRLGVERMRAHAPVLPRRRG